MFLRKLTVMVVPLVLLLGLCVALPLLNGLGFVSNVIKGMLIGLALALLLPLSGAGRKKEPFAVLLWVPAVLTVLVVVYQYLSSTGIRVPVLDTLATTDGQIVLTECIFAGYMLTTCIRTRR